MNNATVNQATLNFIRGVYYYHADNPVWHIYRANALRAAGMLPIQSRMKKWGVWCFKGACWFNQDMENQWGGEAEMRAKAHGLNQLFNPDGKYEARPYKQMKC